MLRQTKSVIVDLKDCIYLTISANQTHLFAQSTNVISNLVFNLGQLLLGFLRHLHHVELRVNVT